MLRVEIEFRLGEACLGLLQFLQQLLEGGELGPQSHILSPYNCLTSINSILFSSKILNWASFSRYVSGGGGGTGNSPGIDILSREHVWEFERLGDPGS